MRHHCGDRVVIIIGRGIGIGEDVAAVEDIQPLILHRAEVEIVDRDDVEDVEVIFAAIDLFVPRHRGLERGQRMLGLGQIGRAHPDTEPYRASRAGREVAAILRQVARHEREQVTGLGERIMPLRPMPPVGCRTAGDRIAVREQYRIARPVRGHSHAIFGQHVGTIGEEGDPPEPLRLALRAQIAARRVQPHQLRVAIGRDLHLGLDDMPVAGQRDHQLFALYPPVVGRGAVDQHHHRLLPRAVEPQRFAVRAVAGDGQRRLHPRPVRGEIEIERDLWDQPIGRAIIGSTGNRRSLQGGRGDAVLDIEHPPDIAGG